MIDISFHKIHGWGNFLKLKKKNCNHKQRQIHKKKCFFFLSYLSHKTEKPNKIISSFFFFLVFFNIFFASLLWYRVCNPVPYIFNWRLTNSDCYVRLHIKSVLAHRCFGRVLLLYVCLRVCLSHVRFDENDPHVRANIQEQIQSKHIYMYMRY